MGGSWDNETAGVGDCSVGSIVWVRRRNGSWWPGKILGTEDLSAAHLMSPRSGTPVKLLGREDASVDWYNLEKSKRVKAFRCGEFDDCIEKAESAQGMPPKRREKYARREDAILHALELEKQLLESKHGQSGYPNGKISKSSDAAKEITTLSGHLGNHDDKHVHSIQHSEERDSTLEEMRTDQGKGSQLEGNNNNDSELLPRMRDLLDLGIGVPASKHKLSLAVTSNRSGRPLLDENTRPPPSGTLITVNVIQTYSKSLLGRKRKSNAIIPDEPLVRKHDKRRPLVQVLQSSADVPVQQSLPAGEEHKGVAPHAERRNSIGLPGESSYCLDGKPDTLNSMELLPSVFEVNNHHPSALNKENTSGSSESTETDSSGTDSLNSDADGNMLEHPDATFDLRSLERLGAQAQHRNMSLKEPDNLVFANDAPRLFPQDFDLAGIAVSQWKNKGKRNSRRFGKKSTDVTDRRPSGGSMYGSHLHVKDGSGFDDPDSSEKILSTQGQTDDYRGNLLISKSTSNCSDGIIHKRDLRGHCEDSSNSLDCAVVVDRHGFPGRTKPVLVDVDVKVQPKFQREHVPMISLMSKLNRKAIIGHPIQIEALEDGSSEILLAAAAAVSYGGEMSNNDDASLPSMWRTARRTSHNRVPRPHPSAKLGSGQTADLQFLDQDKKEQLVKELNVVSSGSGHKASLVRKSSCAFGLPANKKFSRKPLKKISLSSGQKTKTLSSIGVERKAGHNGDESNSCLVNGGLVKVDSGPPAVACIPVKLVFSRFFEDLIGRHQ